MYDKLYCEYTLFYLKLGRDKLFSIYLIISSFMRTFSILYRIIILTVNSD